MDVITIICCAIFGIPVAIWIFWVFASVLKLFWIFGKDMFDDIGY